MAENLFADAETIEGVLQQLAGYASVCWENPRGAGEFQSDRALEGSQAALERIRQIQDAEFTWRLTKKTGDETAHIEIGSSLADLKGVELNLLLHSIGRGLIKAGTLALGSQVDDDEEEDW